MRYRSRRVAGERDFMLLADDDDGDGDDDDEVDEDGV
jgi:hypothetical protein